MTDISELERFANTGRTSTQRAVWVGLGLFQDDQSMGTQDLLVSSHPTEVLAERDISLPGVFEWGTKHAYYVDQNLLQAAKIAARDSQHYRPFEPLTATHLAIRTVDVGSPPAVPGYYVSRTYRALWFGLLVLGIAWGLVGGFALASSTLLSPSAVLMGILGTIVLAATLITAGSRDRIRRR